MMEQEQLVPVGTGVESRKQYLGLVRLYLPLEIDIFFRNATGDCLEPLHLTRLAASVLA